MPIWTLEPLDLENPNWEASTYKAKVIIRAKNEKRARFLAAKAFGTATPSSLGQIVKITPWGHIGSVTCCQLLPSKEYSEEGEEGVLGPSGARLSVHPRDN